MKIVITGASRGLGFSMAEAFAAEGHDLYLTARNEVTLYSALASLMARYPDQVIKAKAFDLAVKQQALDFGNWIVGLGIVTDILINNAGFFEPGEIGNEPDGQLENMLNVNLMSAYYITRTLLPEMKKRQSGHIFNISSVAGLEAYANGGSYSISKFALSGFSKNLREELKQHSIKVTCIYPGAVYTDSWAGSGVAPERIMQPADVANSILMISKLSAQACVEELILRPLKGDL